MISSPHSEVFETLASRKPGSRSRCGVLASLLVLSAGCDFDPTSAGNPSIGESDRAAEVERIDHDRVLRGWRSRDARDAAADSDAASEMDEARAGRNAAPRRGSDDSRQARAGAPATRPRARDRADDSQPVATGSAGGKSEPVPSGEAGEGAPAPDTEGAADDVGSNSAGAAGSGAGAAGSGAGGASSGAGAVGSGADPAAAGGLAPPVAGAVAVDDSVVMQAPDPNAAADVDASTPLDAGVDPSYGGDGIEDEDEDGDEDGDDGDDGDDEYEDDDTSVLDALIELIGVIIGPPPLQGDDPRG